MKRKLLTILFTASILTMTIGLTTFAAPQTMSDGQVFDPEFYAQTYPDVADVFGTNAEALYKHYVSYGKAEERLPYAADSTDSGSSAGSTIQTMPDGEKFDPAYYAQQNPDVVAVVGADAAALYQHYLNNGRAEGRLPYANTDISTTTTASSATTAVANTTTNVSTSTVSSSGSSGYKYSYSEYQAQKERDYAQYQREKEQSYKSNRNKSYSERRADYEKVYKRNQTRRKNTYNRYH